MLEERPFLKDIEKLIRTSIPVVEVHDFEFKMEDAAEPSLKKQGGGGRGRPQGRSNKPKSGSGNTSSRSGGGNRNRSR
jgi:ATP-dependent RNA helicase RhlE